jgi:uncharacterized membrane protein
MIGCIVLTAVLSVLAVKFLVHHRHGRCGGWHGGHWHRGGWRGPGEGRGFGRGGWTWLLLSRLDLSPAQERVVRSEIDTLRQKAKAAREEAGQSRADIANAVRGEEFEEGSLASMFIRHDERLHGLRGDLAGALGRIHAVLDPAQREKLAELIERGPWRARRGGGPYRDAPAEL